MAFAEAGFGGSGGGQFRLRLHADVVAQEINNNRSLVRVTSYFTRISSNGFRYWNFNTTYGNVIIDGNNQGRSIGGYDFNMGVGANYYLMNAQDWWIGHNADGTRYMEVHTSFNADDSPYLTTAGTAIGMWLPTIPRYSEWTHVAFKNVTDVGWVAELGVNATASNLAVSVDGGAWYYLGGNWTYREITIGGALKSGVQHSVKFSAYRPESGLWRETGTYYQTLNSQNNFFDGGF